MGKRLYRLPTRNKLAKRGGDCKSRPALVSRRVDKKSKIHECFVPSPPGTDPDTCRNAFIIYAGSAAMESTSPVLIPLPAIQTDDLYFCSIGSFNIYTTVDAINCAAKTATMNFWMYNAMSRTSFGRFASHPAFALSGLKTQYMWWNWVETVDWSSGIVRTVPRTSSGRRW